MKFNTQPKHTPGPWEGSYTFTKRGSGPIAVIGQDPECREIATVPRKGNQARQEADAALIAAAPDMLAALNLILFAVTDDADTNDGRVDRAAITSLARSAVRKACPGTGCANSNKENR